MARKSQKKGIIQFRYYEMPSNTQVLALLGKAWIREYGEGIDSQHFHNYMEIGVCYEGTGTMMIGEKTYTFGPGNFVIIPENIPHNTTTKENTLAFWEWMYFDIASVFEDLRKISHKKVNWQMMENQVNAKEYFLHKDQHPELNRILFKIRNESEKKEFMYKENIRAFLQTFVIELNRISKGEESEEIDIEEMELNDPTAVMPAIRYVEEHYSEEIKVKDLADECGLSESHFRRLFLKCMNMPPYDYVNLVRIKFACKLLETTTQSMTDVAYNIGFTNVSSFTRNFKKLMGTTPYHWKKSSDTLEGRLYNMKIKALKGW